MAAEIKEIHRLNDPLLLVQRSPSVQRSLSKQSSIKENLKSIQEGSPNSRALWFILGIKTLLSVLNFVATLKYAKSISMLNDAGQLACDIISNLWLLYGQRKGGRTEVRTSFYSALCYLVLVVVSVTLVLLRFLGIIGEGTGVSGGIMMGFSVLGLVVNIICLFVPYFLAADRENRSISTALLDSIGDILCYVCALVAGVVIYLSSWDSADNISSGIQDVIILIVNVWMIAKETVPILLKKVPSELKEDVKNVIGMVLHVEKIQEIGLEYSNSENLDLTCYIVINCQVDGKHVEDNVIAEVRAKFPKIQKITVHTSVDTSKNTKPKFTQFADSMA